MRLIQLKAEASKLLRQLWLQVCRWNDVPGLSRGSFPGTAASFQEADGLSKGLSPQHAVLVPERSRRHGGICRCLSIRAIFMFMPARVPAMLSKKPGLVMPGVGDPDPLVLGYVYLLQHDSADAPVVDDLLYAGYSCCIMLQSQIRRCFVALWCWPASLRFGQVSNEDSPKMLVDDGTCVAQCRPEV